MADQNKKLYEAPETIEYYSGITGLTEAELSIFKQYRTEYKKMRLLDIGVGGGRTTHYLGPLFKEYVAIDYSEKMIKACRDKFECSPKSMNFIVSDVRNMAEFEKGYFDFILFSNNGLDSVSHEERLIALKEIRRVGKKGGYFCFSSHNLNADLAGYYRMRILPDLKRTFKRFKFSLMFYLKNKNVRKLIDGNYALICDDAHFFRLKHYYIKPEAQIEQLTNIGFKNIKLFSFTNGAEVDQPEVNSLKDFAIYYLCNL